MSETALRRLASHGLLAMEVTALLLVATPYLWSGRFSVGAACVALMLVVVAAECEALLRRLSGDR